MYDDGEDCDDSKFADALVHVTLRKYNISNPILVFFFKHSVTGAYIVLSWRTYNEQESLYVVEEMQPLILIAVPRSL